MAEDALKQAEDRVSLFLDGGECSGNCPHTRPKTHPEAGPLAELVMLRQLRLRLPHQSTSVTETEIAIRKELRRLKK